MILERTFAPPCALSCFSRCSESRRVERRCRAVVGPVPCGRDDVAAPAPPCMVLLVVGTYVAEGSAAAYRSCTPYTEANVAPVLFARAAERHGCRAIPATPAATGRPAHSDSRLAMLCSPCFRGSLYGEFFQYETLFQSIFAPPFHSIINISHACKSIYLSGYYQFNIYTYI